MGETPEGPTTAAQRAQPDESDSPGKSGFFSRLFRRESNGADEVREVVAVKEPAAKEDLREMNTREMILNLRNLRHLRVDDISVPRADIVAVAQGAALEEVVEVFRKSEMSRLPVYDETLDKPLGLVHLKDLSLRYGFGAPVEDFELLGLVRPVLYVPPSMRIGVLLQKMQTSRMHMALVIDEYGGVDGLVTIEDVLEQIVGEIGDEHDEEEREGWHRESPDVYLALSRADLEEFEEEIGIKLVPEDVSDEVDTLGGLVFSLSGRVPARGEVVVHPDGHEFEVVEADARRIKRLRVRLKRTEAPGTALGQAAE
jgi:magnesium and cobalt transporter